MIKGFENETSPLTQYEQETLLPAICRNIQLCRGKDKAVTSTIICQWVKRKSGYNLTGPRLRKIMNHIRINGLVPNVLASGDGYYVSTSLNESSEYCDALESRIEAQAAMLRALRKQSQDTFIQQPNLFQ